MDTYRKYFPKRKEEAPVGRLFPSRFAPYHSDANGEWIAPIESVLGLLHASREELDEMPAKREELIRELRDLAGFALRNLERAVDNIRGIPLQDFNSISREILQHGFKAGDEEAVRLDEIVMLMDEARRYTPQPLPKRGTAGAFGDIDDEIDVTPKVDPVKLLKAKLVDALAPVRPVFDQFYRTGDRRRDQLDRLIRWCIGELDDPHHLRNRKAPARGLPREIGEA